MNVQKPTAISVILAVGIALMSLVMHACSSEAPDTTPPAQVTDLRVEAFTETTAVLIWTAPGDDGDRGLAAEYDLRMAVGAPATDWLTAAQADSAVAPPGNAGAVDRASIRGLVFDKVYCFALRTADTEANWSAFSNVVRVEPGDPAPPAQVTDLQAVVLEPHAVTLRFTAPGDDGSAGTAAAYEIRHAATPITESSWQDATAFPAMPAPHAAGTMETIRVTGLTPETTMYIAMRARDDAGQEGPVSNDVEVSLPVDTVPPAAIEDLFVQSLSPFAATLTWTAPGNDGDEGQVASYVIRYAAAQITQATWEAATAVTLSLVPSAAGTTEEVTLTDLPGGHDLWFAVRAVDEKENMGAVSNAVKTAVRVEPRTWVVRKDGTEDATTVQGGINLAASGDTVYVRPGTYIENIDLLGKGIILAGAGPEETILDGSAALRPTVTCASGEPTGTMITGFTIQGGRAVPRGTIPAHGGGVYVEDAEPTILGNVIQDNVAEWSGGGVCCVGDLHGRVWRPEIRANLIIGNRSQNQGGGIYCKYNVAVMIDGNTIRDNVVVVGDGGGISLLTAPIGTVVTNNRIVGNESGDHAGGIMASRMSLETDFAMTIAWNLIAGNVAHQQSGLPWCGGGVFLEDLGAHLNNNTIVGNTCDSGTGSGVAVVYSGTCDITRNIVAFNQGDGAIACNGAATADVYDNLIWSNTPESLEFGCGGIDGPNLIEEPLFCDPANGDYSLAANSPALTYPGGPLGAFPTAGCGAMESKPVIWGRISTLYH